MGHPQGPRDGRPGGGGRAREHARVPVEDGVGPAALAGERGLDARLPVAHGAVAAGLGRSVAVVVVLAMSMLGGSMFPRFLMPEALQSIGLVTFNAWALTAYQKVFWYDADAAALAPQIGVLAAFCVGFLFAARALAARSLAARGARP